MAPVEVETIPYDIMAPVKNLKVVDKAFELPLLDLFFILVDDCNEVTDYAIARRIIDLHTKLEESVERTCTEEEVARYLGFARMFKPKVSMESQELLVQQYKHLRQRDTGGSANSSWRITVRQLESMLRLSESFARLHCSEEA